MTPFEAISKVRGACCVPNNLKEELVDYIRDGQDPQYVVETARQLSEGFMNLTNLYWRVQETAEG